MKLFENGIDYKKLWVYDLETILCCFTGGFYNPDTDEYLQFEISDYKNDLFPLVKFYDSKNIDYAIGYNNCAFDAQVMEYIVQKHQKWINLTSLEITKRIHTFVQNLIESQKYNLLLPYYEGHLSVKQIDPFKIFHFDNKQRRCSLKQCQFSMRWHNVETLPIAHDTEYLSENDINDLTSYMKNDIMSTFEVFKWSLGQSDNICYKGKNKIADRFTMIEEEGLNCLNWSDVKIGEESNLKDYLELSKRKRSEVYPKNVKEFYGRKYKEFFPDTVEFQSEEVKKFVKDFGETIIKNEKQKFVINLGGNIITIGRGGLHSSEKGRILTTSEVLQLLQNDIGSQYPNAYLKYGLFPKHLGVKANELVKRKIIKRLANKKKYKETKDPKYNSLQEMGKLSLNGGLYGKLLQDGSFLYSPECQLKITVGCQLEILMIVEALVLKGFIVTSCNTDGWDVLLDKSREKEYYEICSYYEEKIGNKEMGNIEYTEYEKMYQLSVNDYFAISKNGDVKKKGDFITDFELHKNSSSRIIPLALESYLLKGTDPSVFIKNHTDIFDFCIMSKANSSCTLELRYATGTIVQVGNLVRYYLTNDPDAPEMYKVGKGTKDNDINTAQNAENDLGKQRVKYFNKFTKEDNYDIDYNQYIYKTYLLIDNIESTNKAKSFIESIKPTNQLKLIFD